VHPFFKYLLHNKTQLILYAFISTLYSLSGKKLTCAPLQLPPVDTIFAKGADVGWLSQIEYDGLKFYNSNGTQQDCLQILEEKGY